MEDDSAPHEHVCASSPESQGTLSLAVSDLPATVIEVHSSPYENTITKTITVAMDLLQVCRHHDENVKQYTTFGFPKKSVKQR